jgi:hypothetical protein
VQVQVSASDPMLGEPVKIIEPTVFNITTCHGRRFRSPDKGRRTIALSNGKPATSSSSPVECGFPQWRMAADMANAKLAMPSASRRH